MTVIEKLRNELDRIHAQTPAEAAQEQLNQVRDRIAAALGAREHRHGPAAWREINQRLHVLYVLEYNISRDLASCVS